MRSIAVRVASGGASQRRRRTPDDRRFFDKKGRAARRYQLVDVFPVGFSPGDYSPDSESNLAELHVEVGRVEIDGGDDQDNDDRSSKRQDEPQRAAGFEVEFQPGDDEPTLDGTWHSVRGGTPIIESIEQTVGKDGSRTYTPGKAYVTELTLTGYMTPTRKALLAWMQNTLRQQVDPRIDVTIIPVDRNGRRGKRHEYSATLITRIKIPRLSAGSSDPIKEVVVLRPTRYNDPS